jgi:hypothetical protein
MYSPHLIFRQIKNPKMSILMLLFWATTGCLQAQQNDPIAPISNNMPYPTAPSTGNVAADEKTHIEAKNKWIAEHPDEYKKMGGDPNAVLQTESNTTTTQAAKPQAKKLPEFKAQKTYQLISAEAVLVAGQKASPDEIKQETENLQEEFISNNTELQISDNNIRLFTKGSRDLRAIEKRNQHNKVEWFFENRECETCSKTLYLSIENETESTLTYLMQSEDQNALFNYRLSFQLPTPKP